MSILTTKLPDSIEICKKQYKIRTDFKIWLRFSELITEAADNPVKTAEIFSLVFYELPPNFYEAVKGMLYFYSHDENTDTPKEDNNSVSKKTFDFTYDADLIFSAFWQQYKIDLTTVQMHWWKFRALLGGLGEETKFIKAVGYRSVNISKIKDKEQKKFYRQMKQLYALPDNRTQEQKENDFVNAFCNKFI